MICRWDVLVGSFEDGPLGGDMQGLSARGIGSMGVYQGHSVMAALKGASRSPLGLDRSDRVGSA